MTNQNNLRDEYITEIEHFMGLTFPDEQLEIIVDNGRPVNTISCAGSGKTTLLIARVCYLQMKHKVKPNKIIIISFNKTAVDEIQGRYNHLATFLNLGNVTFKTFHALYYLILNYYKRTIFARGEMEVLPAGESAMLFGRAFYSNSQDKSDEAKEEMLSLRSYAVNNLITSGEELRNTPKFRVSDLDYNDYLRVVGAYRESKTSQGVLDFDDLQVEMYNLIKGNADARARVEGAWDYWFIDEYQDISKVQKEILRMTIKDANNLTVIGDEDQSIYEFRGSKADYILDFPIYFKGAKRFIMSTNYRCPSVILGRAKQSITFNTKRIDKPMSSYNEGGLVEYISKDTSIATSIEIAERVYKNFMDEVPLSEIAVLYRNTSQQIYVVDQLVQKGVPVKVLRKSNLLHNHRIVRDIRDIMALALDSTDSEAFGRVFTKITQFFGRSKVNTAKRQMDSTLGSWEDILSHETNDSIWSAKHTLDTIRKMIDEGTNVSQIISEVLTLYMDYVTYIKGNSEVTEREIDGVLEYIYYIGADKTHKQFIYYLERAKSIIDLYDSTSDAVTVTTMHTVKGLEFDYVYLVDVTDEVLPSTHRISFLTKTFSQKEAQDYIEQERRLFYVASTRAKKKLTVTTLSESESRFIGEQLNGTGKTVEDISEAGLLIRDDFLKAEEPKIEKGEIAK